MALELIILFREGTLSIGVATLREEGQWGTLSATNPVALVPDRSTKNTTFLILRCRTSASGFIAERVPNFNPNSSLRVPTSIECVPSQKCMEGGD